MTGNRPIASAICRVAIAALVVLLVPLAAGAMLASGPTTEPSAAGDRISRGLAAGLEALAAGDAVRAETEFRGVHEVAPTHAGAMLGLAQALEAQRRPVEALVWVRRAADLEPTSAVLGYTAALMARVGRPEEALGYFARLREVAPKEPTGYVAPALLLRDLDRRAEAIDLLEAGVAAQVRGGELDVELGYLLLAEGDAARARQVAMRAREAGGAESGAATLLALAAAELFEAGSIPLDEALRWLDEGVRFGTTAPAAVRLARARVLAGAGRTMDALADLDAVLELDPESREAHYERGLALQALGRDEEARRALDRLQALTGAAETAENRARQLGMALNEAQDLANRNELAAALAALEPLRSAHPDFAPILALRAKILFSMGRGDEALVDVARARELDPARTEYHYLEALFASRLGDWEAAASSADRALTLEPALEEARRILDEARRQLATGPQG